MNARARKAVKRRLNDLARSQLYASDVERIETRLWFQYRDDLARVRRQLRDVRRDRDRWRRRAIAWAALANELRRR